MNEVIMQLGTMQWPFLLLSSIALALILERIWVLLEAFFKLKQYKVELSNLGNAEEKMRLFIQKKVVKWQRRFAFVSLIGMVSPLVGLLGTVWGLVTMFKEIAGTQQAVTPALLADGLWGAMYSTVVGLVIAIPCILINGVGQSLVEYLQTELTLFANERVVNTPVAHA